MRSLSPSVPSLCYRVTKPPKPPLPCRKRTPTNSCLSEFVGVCRSTFAAETIAAAEALDELFLVRSLTNDTFNRMKEELLVISPPIMCTDCRSLLDHVESRKLPVTEKRLMVDLSVITESVDKDQVVLHLYEGNKGRATSAPPLYITWAYVKIQLTCFPATIETCQIQSSCIKRRDRP